MIGVNTELMKIGGYFYKFKKSYNPNMYVPYETKLDHARKLFQAYRMRELSRSNVAGC
jgi:hypothetical protein